MKCIEQTTKRKRKRRVCKTQNIKHEHYSDFFSRNTIQKPELFHNALQNILRARYNEADANGNYVLGWDKNKLLQPIMPVNIPGQTLFGICEKCEGTYILLDVCTKYGELKNRRKRRQSFLTLKCKAFFICSEASSPWRGTLQIVMFSYLWWHMSFLFRLVDFRVRIVLLIMSYFVFGGMGFRYQWTFSWGWDLFRLKGTDGIHLYHVSHATLSKTVFPYVRIRFHIQIISVRITSVSALNRSESDLIRAD